MSGRHKALLRLFLERADQLAAVLPWVKPPRVDLAPTQRANSNCQFFPARDIRYGEGAIDGFRDSHMVSTRRIVSDDKRLRGPQLPVGVAAPTARARTSFAASQGDAEQRATVLSFDSLMGSLGGVVVQPTLGRVADVGGYSASYVVAGAIQAIALPFMLLARREKAPSDPLVEEPEPV